MLRACVAALCALVLSTGAAEARRYVVPMADLELTTAVDMDRALRRLERAALRACRSEAIGFAPTRRELRDCAGSTLAAVLAAPDLALLRDHHAQQRDRREARRIYAER